jgi:hypothetical protein
VTKSKSTRSLPTTIDGWREEAERIRTDLNEQLGARNKEIRSLTKRAQSAEGRLAAAHDWAVAQSLPGHSDPNFEPLLAILDGKAE